MITLCKCNLKKVSLVRSWPPTAKHLETLKRLALRLLWGKMVAWILWLLGLLTIIRSRACNWVRTSTKISPELVNSLLLTEIKSKIKKACLWVRKDQLLAIMERIWIKKPILPKNWGCYKILGWIILHFHKLLVWNQKIIIWLLKYQKVRKRRQ